MTSPYALPKDFQLPGFPQEALRELEALLVRRNSLPWIGDPGALAGLDPEALQAMAWALDEIQVTEARRDAAAFMEYVLTSERSAKTVKNAPHHIAWQRFIDSIRLGVLVSPVEMGKTQQVAVGRTLWELGNDPNKRVALIGESEDAAKKLLGSIKQHILENERLHKVFPNLKKSERPGSKWNETDITVERDVIAKDPSIQARGVGGSIIGSRLDLIVLDDIHNRDNQATKAQIDKLEEWFDSTIITRLWEDYEAGEFGKCLLIGTPWNTDDMLHRLKERPGWKSIWFHAVEDPTAPEDQWKPIWPEQWPLERLLDRQRGMTPQNFMRKYLTVVRIDANSPFKREYLAHALFYGKRYILGPDLRPRGRRGRALPTFTGVDIGLGQGEGHDLTVLCTIAKMDTGQYLIVDVDAGKWEGPDILVRVERAHKRYGSLVMVEGNQAQRWMAQFGRQRGVPTVSRATTKANKHDEAFGVASLSVDMKGKLWAFPSGADGHTRWEHLDALMRALLNYTEDPKTHVSDYIMAMWIARECARVHSGQRVVAKDSHLRR